MKTRELTKEQKIRRGRKLMKYRYLSKEWINSDFETQIKEIAHNIRNYYNNRRLKQVRLYHPNQPQLF